ncbi:LysE family translocator [Bacillus haynesii]|uniref:LysE family translocator n=1 Tax=Bacillus haynesii TaxID=1925021 RepID=UPI00227EBFE9|nr:LysE family translocator [Bacillus haynesii]MCY8671840.1 LysE family translocator [Bacillus haynesii]MEC1448279.1 LysE family translocator [Bacillus haynesii]MEC1473032.1 LysE family translocator [Bacillus haynesii]MEC1476239.1 LysE family translocator [Bacillus haynesii]MEC1483378.1 LysE family translocator [Bacillus haynesii]
MDMISIVSFLGAAVLLTLMPGPDNLFVLAQSISKGKPAGIATACGLCTGLIVHIIAAAAGISAAIYQSAVAFSIVKYAGAAYLLFLAYQSFRQKSAGFNLEAKDSLNRRALYQKGVVMNLLNPKVSLFFLAFLPQFIHPGPFNVTTQMLVYGMLFLIQAFVIFVMISLFAEKVGDRLRRSPQAAKKVHLLEGSLFALIGLKIAVSQR